MGHSFAGLEEGRSLYRVVRQGEVVFTGTRDECARFLAIRREKERRDVEGRFSDPDRRSPTRTVRA